ncbi:MAG: nucleoside-diphosphate kinase [Candidatus Asgardarchaeia archaeon]
MERTLIIIKPDGVVRGRVGEILSRFERKGLKIIGMKMASLGDDILEKHYSHLADKPFFRGLVDFMKKTPVVLIVLEGRNAVEVVRQMCGPTDANKAPPGTIRGDFAISVGRNIIHASDSLETAKVEISRFFKDDELHEYGFPHVDFFYAEDEKDG